MNNRNASQLDTIGTQVRSKADNPLYGKKITFLGDSLTHGNDLGFNTTWAYKIAERNDMVAVDMGINGTCLAINNTYGDSMLNRYINIPTDSDYIVIWGGTNDYGNNVTEAIFKTAIENLCKGLYNNYPTTKFIFLTPRHTTNSSNSVGLKQSDYNSFFIEKLNEFSAPRFDVYNEGGFYFYFTTQKDTITTDGTHFNEIGNVMMADKVEKRLYLL